MKAPVCFSKKKKKKNQATHSFLLQLKYWPDSGSENDCLGVIWSLGSTGEVWMAVNVNWYSLERKKKWKDLVHNESFAEITQGMGKGEIPESQSHASVGSRLVILQCGCTQFSFHWNLWVVAILGQASHYLWLRRRPGCKKFQAPAGYHPQPYLSSQEKGDIGCHYYCLLNRRTAAMFHPLHLADASVVLQANATVQLCFTSPCVCCAGDCNAILTLFCSHTLQEKTVCWRTSCLLTALISFITHGNAWHLLAAHLTYLYINTIYKWWEKIQMQWTKFPFAHISIQEQSYHLRKNSPLPLVDAKEKNPTYECLPHHSTQIYCF